MATVVKHRRLTKKSSKIKLAIVSVLLLIGIVLSIFSFNIPFINNGLTRFNSFASSIKIGGDLKSGVYAVFETTDTDPSNLSERMINTRQRLQSLLAQRGHIEAVVTNEGDKRIRVESADINDPVQLFTAIGTPQRVKFAIDDNVIINKERIEKVSTITSGSSVGIEIILDGEGSKTLRNETSNHINETLNVIISTDGQEDQTIPVTIAQAITNGKVPLSGMKTQAQAEQTATQIMSGSFESQLKLVIQDNMQASLGQATMLVLLLTLSVGVLAVLIYMCIKYKWFGGVLAFGSLAYVVLALFLCAVVPWVLLGLSGTVGLMLGFTLFMCSNMLVFSRLKEEYLTGKSLNASLASANSRATISNLDIHAVVGIIGIVFAFFGGGVLQGFGTGLLIGFVASCFASLLISRKALKWVATILGQDRATKLGLKRGIGVVEIEDPTEKSSTKNISEKSDLKQAVEIE